MPAKTKQTKTLLNAATEDVGPVVDTVVQVQPVATPVVDPVVQVQPVATPAVEQKAGAKGKPPAKNKKVNEVVEPVAVEEPVVQKGSGKKNNKKAEEKTETVAHVAVAHVAVEQVGAGKKPAARKAKAKSANVDTDDASAKPKKAVQKKAVAKKTNTTEDTQEAGETTTNGKLVRSFKVLLPEKEEYEGRFTGLTPYQAANKALSKYFRENKNVENIATTITFQICESTRKSNKHEYKYTGSRVKLDVPVSYTIQDGRVISKNFKNILKKVKKTEPVAADATA
jgi:hypothetical protein